MAGYKLSNQMAGTPQALTTTYKSQLRLTPAASLPKRIRILELRMSATGTPSSAETQVQSDFSHYDATTAGTSTTGVPIGNDLGIAITAIDVAVSVGHINYTVEPTALVQTQCYYNKGFSQHSYTEWFATPGREIIQPAAPTLIGPVWRALSPLYTGAVSAETLFEEL
jgi:hypothetical protein